MEKYLEELKEESFEQFLKESLTTFQEISLQEFLMKFLE